ncbi:hypothetical protein ElyMa_004139500 [Elysia marginata]|uniref:Uncharacterized protein n=1 Tax=Elysia marginata TaxID=1093978 RepID=A0AAV4GGB8_9GAST|nr:hypothetical protein ElyMa_004139500 [Elysia marginata]
MSLNISTMVQRTANFPGTLYVYLSISSPPPSFSPPPPSPFPPPPYLTVTVSLNIFTMVQQTANFPDTLNVYLSTSACLLVKMIEFHHKVKPKGRIF